MDERPGIPERRRGRILGEERLPHARRPLQGRAVQRLTNTEYLVPDLLAPGLRLILCGSAPSTISARAHAYYANPQNKFWRTLHLACLTPRQFSPQEYSQLLPLGIGLTDLAKRHAGADAALPKHAWDRAEFLAKIEKYPPALLAFTSKRAASEALLRPTGKLPYGRQPAPLLGAEVWVLPSTSPLGDNHFRLEPWLALGERFRERDQSG